MKFNYMEGGDEGTELSYSKELQQLLQVIHTHTYIKSKSTEVRITGNPAEDVVLAGARRGEGEKDNAAGQSQPHTKSES